MADGPGGSNQALLLKSYHGQFFEQNSCGNSKTFHRENSHDPYGEVENLPSSETVNIYRSGKFVIQ